MTKKKLTPVVEDNFVDESMSPSEYVKIMSLVPFGLNLSTRERGQGKTFKFSSFGEVKNVLYQDLLDIMETHRNFMESGYFFILNPKVVRIQGLNDLYNRILTKEKIEQILTGAKDYMEVFNACNDSQKNVIVEMIVDKLFKEPESIDLNVVDKISRVSGRNIQARVDDLRESVLSPDKKDKEEN